MTVLSKFLGQHDACGAGREWIKAQKIKTLAEAWEKCQRGDWMIWMLDKSGKVASDKTVWARIACPIARRVLPIFERWNQADKRPREAIAARERWVADPTEANERECQARAAEAAWAAWAARAAGAAGAAEAAEAARAAGAAGAAEAAEAARAAGAAGAAEAAEAAELQTQADDLRKMFPKWGKIGR